MLFRSDMRYEVSYEKGSHYEIISLIGPLGASDEDALIYITCLWCGIAPEVPFADAMEFVSYRWGQSLDHKEKDDNYNQEERYLNRYKLYIGFSTERSYVEIEIV